MQKINLKINTKEKHTISPYIYMQFMEPARMEAKAALEAYNGNDLGPIADLLANSILHSQKKDCYSDYLFLGQDLLPLL